jgi:hypothetical protein
VGVDNLSVLKADVVEGFIIDAESLVRVFNQLVDGERRVVWLTIDAFSLLTHNIQDSVDKLSTFSIICKPIH